MKARLLFAFVAIASIFSLGILGAQAATLNFSPPAGTHANRTTFTVGVYVQTPGTAVNAFSGDVSYPADRLSVVSISKSGSIVNFWTTEPKATNGAVHFEGVALNPGFTGNSGKILSITFRAQEVGTAGLKFLSASVLANDGLGTNVLSATGTATYTIIKEEVEPEGNTLLPMITSTTHPSDANWYSVRAAELAWAVPPQVTTVAYTTNANPSGVPTTTFGLAKGRTTPVLADGVWYTHVRFRTSAGWGPVAHFKTQIDGTAPTNIAAKNISESHGAKAMFELTAEDALSGIERFGVVVDDGPGEVAVSKGETVTRYETTVLRQGMHTLLVKAYDHAGNIAEYSSEFEITHLDPPTITEYPSELKNGDFLIIRGKTYPDTNVEITLVRKLPVRETLMSDEVYIESGEPIVEIVHSDSSGAFTFAYSERLPYGRYTASGKVLLEQTMSDPSEEVLINVREGILLAGFHLVMTPRVLVPILLLLLIISIYISVRTMRRYRALAVAAAKANRTKETERVSG